MTTSTPFKNRTVFIAIAVLCFIVYGNSLQNGYNLDDAWAFQAKGNADLITGLKESFTTSFVNIGELNYGYRPVSAAVFTLEKALFGQNPVISHFLNITFYILVCYALFIWLSGHVRIGWWLAITITAAYLLLPIHSEVVNSVKNRDELLSALFGILFLIQSWKFYRTGNYWSIAWIVLFFVLSLLSKHNTIPLLAVVPVGLWVMGELNKKRLLIMSVLPLITVILIQVTIGSTVDLGVINTAHEVVENPLFGEHTGGDRLTIATNALGFYLTGIVSLHEFGSYFGLKTIDFLSLQLSYLVAVILFVCAGIVLLIAFLRKRKFKLPLFAFAFFVACIFPFLNLLQRMPGVVGERLAFLASIGMAIFIGWLIYTAACQLKKASSKGVSYLLFGALIGLVLFWSVKTINRNAEWSSLETLMAADLEKFPQSVKMNMIMGSVQYNKGVKTSAGTQQVTSLEQVELARDYFSKALEVEVNHAVAIYNIAWIDTYLLNGDPERVENEWWKLVALDVLDSNSVMPHIIRLKEQQGNSEDAINESLRLCNEGNKQMGINGLRLAMADSDWDMFWEFSQCAYAELGTRQAKLSELWKRLKTTDAVKAEALINALIARDKLPYFGKVKAQQLMLDGKLAEAMTLLSQLDSRFPNDLEIQLLFGNLYTSFNQSDNALKAFKRALELDPTNEGLRQHVQSLENQ